MSHNGKKKLWRATGMQKIEIKIKTKNRSLPNKAV